MKKLNKNSSLILVVIILISSPLLFLKDAEFKGADSQAEEVINEMDPNYIPWFNPLIKPASSEIESLLFSLQSAAGAGVIGYFFGFVRGKRSVKNNKK